MEKGPKHVWFTMDGNRRWARQQNLALIHGHSKGTENIEPLVEESARQGIEVVSFWAFSTENWNRPKEEVADIMDVFRSAIKDPMIERLQQNGVRVNIIGDITPFPEDIREGVEHIIYESRNNNRIIANFALNYGGRKEIVAAVNAAISDGYTKISEDIVDQYIYTHGQPDVDILIRTGNESRTSGAATWTSAYAELYFSKSMWPDFGVDEYRNILSDYRTNRQRRFGK